MKLLIALISAPLCLAAVATPQSLPAGGRAEASPQPVVPVAVFAGPAGAFGEIALYDERSGRPLAQPPRLRDLRLLPIECVGRTELEAFLPDRARWRADVPGASRLILPHGRGSLLRTERMVAVGSAFGFLRIDARGRPHLVGEIPGIGAGADEDPLIDRVAVSPDGRSLLIATVVDAGGDLIELDLERGTSANRTSHLAPLQFGNGGLWLAEDWGFGVASSGILRFGRGLGELAELVPLSDPASWFSRQAVFSAGRVCAATTAGSGPAAQYVYVFAREGPAQRVGDAPARLSRAGFLPDAPAGPYLAVSDDGSLAAWRTEVTTPEGPKRELFLGRVASAPETPEHVSSDLFFADTIDQIGALGFRAAVLSMAMGSVGDGGGLEDVDLFNVELVPQADPVFTNRTLSSGETSPPFLAPGEIDPAVMCVVPGLGLLVHDDKGEALLGLAPGQVGPTVITQDVKEVEFVELAGPGLAVGVRRSFDPRPKEVHRVDSLEQSSVLLLADSPDASFRGVVRGPQSSIAYVVEVLGVSLLIRLDVASGVAETLQGGSEAFTTPIGFTPAGATLAALGPPMTAQEFFSWRPGGAVKVLRTPAIQGHFLTGR